MAKVVNIRQDVDDSFYRYKMPQLLTKIEGKGNGIKTVLPNISEVARALSRPPTYPTKFFGCELGAQTMWDEKADRYIVNGAHDASRLRELLVVFIDKFVLCPSCKNPETDLILTRDDFVVRDCKACGERKNVDMRHKLITFITKNPPQPKAKKGGQKKAGADAEEAATAAALAQQAGGGVNGSSPSPANGAAAGADADDDGSDDELTRRIREGAKELEASGVGLSELAKTDWSADTSKDAVATRLEALQSGIQSALVLDSGGGKDDEEGGDEGPYGTFGSWLADNRSATDADVIKQAEELGIEKKHKAAQAIGANLFDAEIVKQIPQRSALLQKIITSEKHQKSLLGGIELLVGETHPDLTAAVPKILMALYQDDVLEEDVITYWAGHASSKYVDKSISKQVRRAAKPFITWLEKADSNDEEE